MMSVDWASFKCASCSWTPTETDPIRCYAEVHAHLASHYPALVAPERAPLQPEIDWRARYEAETRIVDNVWDHKIHHADVSAADRLEQIRELWVQEGMAREFYYVDEKTSQRRCVECDKFGNEAEPHATKCIVGKFEDVLAGGAVPAASPICFMCKQSPPPPQVCNDEHTIAICGACAEKVAKFLRVPAASPQRRCFDCAGVMIDATGKCLHCGQQQPPADRPAKE